MLRVKHLQWYPAPQITDTGETLFTQNPSVLIEIEAPIFWWLDTPFRFNIEDLVIKKKMTDICMDAWKKDSAVEQVISSEVIEIQSKLDIRQLIQILPLGTLVTGNIVLEYQEIIEYVEDYLDGTLFDTEVLPTKREWTDLCETLMDIKGVRNVVRRYPENE